jgi:hypothetical protein
VIDIAKETAWLAAQIGELTPRIETLDELREYTEYVAETLQTRAYGVDLMMDELREHLDPDDWRRKFYEGRGGERRRGRRSHVWRREPPTCRSASGRDGSPSR